MIVYKQKLSAIEKKEIDSLIEQKSFNSIIQHYDFPISKGEKKFVLIYDCNQKLIGYASVFLSCYSFFPFFKIAKILYGPILLNEKDDLIVMQEIVSFFKKSKRILSLEIQRNSFCNKQQPLSNSISNNLRATLFIDLKCSEEDIFKSFSSVLKKNIKSAKNKGVTIEHLSNRDAIDSFVSIYESMCRYRGVSLSNAENVTSVCNFLFSTNKGFILLVKFENTIIGGGVFLNNGNTCTYYIGATDEKYKKIPTSHYLLYQAILEAKNTGMSFFDFGGYDLNTSSEKQSFNINQFKIQFSQDIRVYTEPLMIINRPIIKKVLSFISSLKSKITR